MIDHVDVAFECGYFDIQKAEDLTGKIKTAIQILNGYIRYLRQRKEID